MKVSKVYQKSDAEFKKIVKKAESFSDCLRLLGLTTRGGSCADILKQRIAELKCDTTHFGKTYVAKTNSYKPIRAKYSLKEILVENSPYKNIACLKRRLLKEHILDYKCACCGLQSWRGKPISLQLHHKNGINTDHRLENIELLCPNCHSLTDTYSGKNINRSMV